MFKFKYSIVALLLSSLFITGCCGTRESSQSNLVDLVNPLQGSNSVREFSTGNTYPAVARPWAMNFWTPQTRRNGDGWQYVYTDATIQGFKQTHQPSPWINDYGCFSLMPQLNTAVYNQEKRAVGFSHSEEVSHPYYYGVKLENGIKSEITTSNSGAIFRLSYPEDGDAILLVDCFQQMGEVSIDSESGRIEGLSKFYAKNNNAKLPDNFATHFTIEFNKPIVSYGVFEQGRKSADKASAKGNSVAMYVNFGDERIVEAKVASSFISQAQAKTNLNNELATCNFEQLKKASYNEWNDELHRVAIKGGTLEQQRTFYTALYRSMLFPRKTYEFNTNGEQVHYSFYTGEVESGAMYADNGFWDTFRAVHPLFTILHPTISGEVIEAMLNIYEQGGYLPEWFSPAYKNCMIGQNSVSIITDAYAKGVRDFDVEKAFEAMIKGANSQGPNATGRVGFDYYNELGYVPCDVGIKESVSRTLEYAYNDFCIAKFAEMIGKDSKTVDLYRNRAMNYKNIFDKSINFVRPKSKSGAWEEDYAPDMWGASFTEGSAWHWTWCVFHDPAGLIELMGGDDNFVAKLDSVFETEPTVNLRHFKKMIHEMAEMIAGDMGQYAHGNQPIQHMIYLYNYAGAPYKAQYHIRNVMDKLYSSGFEDGCGLCGDEDNGQTSAWYVFSAMGFYPVCPGETQYVIGTPLFEEINLTLESGLNFKVIAHNNSPENRYIQSATLNGDPFNQPYIDHTQIMEGGVLEFQMGATPNKDWAASTQNRPYSMSNKTTNNN